MTVITPLQRDVLKHGVMHADVVDDGESGRRLLRIVIRPEYEGRLLTIFRQVLGFAPETDWR